MIGKFDKKDNCPRRQSFVKAKKHFHLQFMKNNFKLLILNTFADTEDSLKSKGYT